MDRFLHKTINCAKFRFALTEVNIHRLYVNFHISHKCAPQDFNPGKRLFNTFYPQTTSAWLIVASKANRYDDRMRRPGRRLRRIWSSESRCRIETHPIKIGMFHREHFLMMHWLPFSQVFQWCNTRASPKTLCTIVPVRGVLGQLPCTVQRLKFSKSKKTYRTILIGSLLRIRRI